MRRGQHRTAVQQHATSGTRFTRANQLNIVARAYSEQSAITAHGEFAEKPRAGDVSFHCTTGCQLNHIGSRQDDIGARELCTGLYCHGVGGDR